MRNLLLALAPLAVAVVFAGSAPAQSCSDLTVSGTGAPGTDLTFDLSGAAAEAPAVLFVGPDTGTTTISFGPLGMLELGLTPPFALVLMGTTDSGGNVSLTIPIPNAPIPSTDLNAQATSIEFTIGRSGPPSLDFCTSDVEAFQVGS